MKGNPKIIEALQKAIKSEFNAIQQWLLHYEQLKNWGYKRLKKHVKAELEDERDHVHLLAERLLFFDVDPAVNDATTAKCAKEPKDVISINLRLETDAISLYNGLIEIVEEECDYETQRILIDILRDENEHADWLQKQLAKIGQLGYQNWLSEQD